MLSKRLSKIAPLFASAVAVGLGAHSALATLTVDVRVISVTGGGTSVAGGKSIANAVVGSTVTMGVWAQVHGNDPTRSQTLNIVSGSFLSSNGGLLGNLSVPNVSSNFKNLSWSLGFQQDLDGDTDNDLGSNDDSNADNFFRARSIDNPTGPNSAVIGTGNNAMVVNNINSTTTEYRIAILRFIVTASPTGSTSINFRPRITSDGTAAVWQEDAIEEGNSDDGFTYDSGQVKTDGVSPVLTGASVVINTPAGPTPEPASLGLIGMAGLGLLARRRKA